MTRWLTTVGVFMALATGAAACGGDEEEAGSPTGATTAESEPTPSDTGESAGGGETKTVDMKDIKYVPAELTVKAGTTVRWTNSDQVPHTVTNEEGSAKFDSGNIEPGGDYERTFDKPGEIPYLCTIHPGQSGTVTVE